MRMARKKIWRRDCNSPLPQGFGVSDHLMAIRRKRSKRPGQPPWKVANELMGRHCSGKSLGVSASHFEFIDRIHCGLLVAPPAHQNPLPAFRRRRGQNAPLRPALPARPDRGAPVHRAPAEVTCAFAILFRAWRRTHGMRTKRLIQPIAVAPIAMSASAARMNGSGLIACETRSLPSIARLACVRRHR